MSGSLSHVCSIFWITGQFFTGETARQRLDRLLGQVGAAYQEMGEAPTGEVDTAFREQIAERPERQQRLNRALLYRTFAQIADPPEPKPTHRTRTADQPRPPDELLGGDPDPPRN